MNLAWHDIRHRLGRFLGISFGVSLLFTVVLAMAGIYQGLVLDSTSLARAMNADLWIVQRGTFGPFADASKIDPTVEARAATVPGVRRARTYTYQSLQRVHRGRDLRFALIGLAWPDDRGERLPIIAGRALGQAHGELVVDASLGLPIGERITLGRDDYTVVGLTRGVLTTGGDAAAFLTQADAQLVMADAASDAIMTERERRRERLRGMDLGRSQPGLEDLLMDPEFKAPVLATPAAHAVLVDVDSPARVAEVRAAIGRWPDVSVFSQGEEEQLLIQGVVQKARLQLGMFAMILTLTSSVLVAIIVYTMTTDKTHEIAVMKLMGASRTRLALMVTQQAWLLGAIAYALAVLVGTLAFPHFPRRVVVTDNALQIGALLVLVVTTLSSMLGVAHALRVDAGKVLEG